MVFFLSKCGNWRKAGTTFSMVSVHQAAGTYEVFYGAETGTITTTLLFHDLTTWQEAKHHMAAHTTPPVGLGRE